MDPVGRWVVIEIKRGNLLRETVTQVIDYTASLSRMTEDEVLEKIDPTKMGHSKSLRELLEERDALDSLSPKNRNLAMIIVGTGQTPGLDGFVSFLTESYEVPLTLVTFNVFKTASGSQILVRKLTEPDIEYSVINKKQSYPSVEEHIKAAHNSGIGDAFQRLVEIGAQFNLYPRLWKTSIMFAPPTKRTIWTSPVNEKLKYILHHQQLLNIFNYLLTRFRKH